MIRSFLFKYVILFFISFGLSAKGIFLYSQPIDILNFFTILSKDVGVKSDIDFQKEWIKENGVFSDDDKEHLKNFREVKRLYDSPSTGKLQFTNVFLTAKSIDEALTNLRRVLTQDEVTRVANCIKHFRVRAIKFISQSNSFMGKIKELEGILSKSKFEASYKDALKFFQLKPSSQSKIYFVWSTKEHTTIEYFDHIVLVGIHPLSNLYDFLDVGKVLDILMSSLFSSLSSTQEKNFLATILQDGQCSKESLEVLKYVFGKLHFKYISDKKTFDLYTDHFVDKKLNMLAISVHSLYEGDLALKKNIFGSFPNKVNYLCSLIK